MSRLKPPVFAVAVLWAVFLVDGYLTGIDLRVFGLVPRETDRLWAILTIPFLHGHMAHLIGNSIPLLLFGWLVMRRGTGRFIAASAFIIVVGGVFLWLIGRPALHIGASGWVFGLWGLIIADGWYERTPTAVLTSLLVILLYGGMVWGLLPQATVSFEAHLGGLVAGVLYSGFSHRNRRVARR
ncbi:rhomboid family intramembrane serine protease [Saccharospirillum salsuginis]|uniref:Rhomboid family intramembrane serine protease n=1 Tax=Saccharospirillum salsuginis TaxID=418750 RepID=A0A918K1K0_9GAMM|nr:rhomboid family intramembrane serine protease [Saccharospirillum salsuginis]GGX41708.1 rhomboid family intramembrane serine protease [Saccharospirillum salsuginis]